MGILATAIVALGWFPQLLIKGVFQPGLHTWGLHADVLDEYLTEMFLSPKDLMSVVIAFALGFTFFFAGMRFGLFHLHAPKWFGVDYWYRQAARGLVAFCGVVDRAYEALRHAVSRLLRRGRFEYAEMAVRLSRRRRLFISTMLTGAPGARDQHFIGHASIVLERERQDSVRLAVLGAVRSSRETGGSADKALIDAVRDIAGYIAQRLMNERMGVLSDLARTGDLQAARVAFTAAVSEIARTRVTITQTALRLAPMRMRGENVGREIASAVNALISAERFDLMLAPQVPGGAIALERTAEAGVALRNTLPTRTALRAAGTGGLTWLERAATWLLEITRLVVDALTRERSDWTAGSRFDDAAVVSMRLHIQHYARDIGLSVAVVSLMFLLFVLALAL
jgi:hypothetical protein